MLFNAFFKRISFGRRFRLSHGVFIMEKFNLLDFIARLGEAYVKKNGEADRSQSDKPSAESSNSAQQAFRAFAPAQKKEPAAKNATNSFAAVNSGDELFPYGTRALSDNEKALVEMIRKHDIRSKKISEATLSKPDEQSKKTD